jgi:hypothetical protein
VHKCCTSQLIRVLHIRSFFPGPNNCQNATSNRQGDASCSVGPRICDKKYRLCQHICSLRLIINRQRPEPSGLSRMCTAAAQTSTFFLPYIYTHFLALTDVTCPQQLTVRCWFLAEFVPAFQVVYIVPTAHSG